MLNLLEEIVLLTIDARTGRLTGGSELWVRYALAGAILFDLALANRIDTDIDKITVIDDKPIGSHLHDELLASLAKKGGSHRVRSCIEEIFRQGNDLEGVALAHLIEEGIIRQEKSKLMWLVDLQKLRFVDGTQRQLITARLAHAVLTDDIPEVRDIMLVSLTAACGLLNVVLAPGQIELRAERIETLSKIETISRNVGNAIVSLLEAEALGRGLAGMF